MYLPAEQGGAQSLVARPGLQQQHAVRAVHAVWFVGDTMGKCIDIFLYDLSHTNNTECTQLDCIDYYVLIFIAGPA